MSVMLSEAHPDITKLVADKREQSNFEEPIQEFTWSNHFKWMNEIWEIELNEVRKHCG